MRLFGWFVVVAALGACGVAAVSDPAACGPSSPDAGPPEASDAGSADAGPVDVTGRYAVTITNGANACGLPGWVVGAQGPGVVVDLKQNAGADAFGAAGGINVGGILDPLSGFPVFTGAVSGDSVDLFSLKMAPTTIGSCTFRLFGRLHAKRTAAGSVAGSLTYTLFPTGGTCANPECRSVQTFE